MKRCNRCNQQKPLREFYRHRDMSDGHLNKCMACTRREANARSAAKVNRRHATKAALDP